MSTLTHNSRAERYQAVEGGHCIAIEEDMFMIELQCLQDSGLSEAEALDELFDVQWWYDHLPMSGVFIDGIEQIDEAQLIEEARRQSEVETTVYKIELERTETRHANT